MHNGGPRYSPAPSCDEAEIYDTPPSDECNGNTIEVDMCESQTNTLSSLVRKKGDGPKEKFLIQERLERNLHGGDVFYVKSCVNRRTALERYLCMFCFLFFVGCVVMMTMLLTVHKGNGPMGSLNLSRADRLQQAFPQVCLSEDCVKTAAALLNSMDQTVDPCDNFFEYACGAFNRENKIPDDKSIIDTFMILHKKMQTQLQGLLETPESSSDSTAIRKVKNLYKSCINTSSAEDHGDTVLMKMIADLGGWPVINSSWNEDSFHLEDMLSALRMRFNVGVMMKSDVGIDDKNSSRHMFEIDQPSLGLPNRDYFLQSSFAKVRSVYVSYMVNIAVMHGANQSYARREMQDVLDFETRLANITLTETRRADRQEMVKVMTIQQLERAIPQIFWRRYLAPQHPTLNDENARVALLSSEFFNSLPDILASTNKRTVANYLIWITIMTYAEDLTSEYRKKRMELQEAIEGVKKEENGWSRCVDYCNNYMGMALGSMFVTKYFDKESKSSAIEMIRHIRQAFNELLDVNDWMDDETRVVAKEKAVAMKERIGYPDFILNSTSVDTMYENVTCSPTDFFSNVIALEQNDVKNSMTKLMTPVDHDEWEQRPALVNAFYNPNFNEILFPAGILQPLFYSRHSPKSMNYGGIGVVIGHEITHGFDEKGRKYNKDGNMQQWWNNRTIEAFKARAKCIELQYSNYTVDGIDVKMNGLLTLGENIADNGGIKQAYKAYRKWVEENGEEQLLPGVNLTHDQLFFLNYAQIWCGSMRKKSALKWVRTEVHSPNPIRALGPLANSKDFAAAFQCPLGSRMNPVKKCSVW